MLKIVIIKRYVYKYKILIYNGFNKNRIKKIEAAGFKSKFVEFEQTVKQT